MKPRTQSEVALLLHALPHDYRVQSRANTAVSRHELRVRELIDGTGSCREKIDGIAASRRLLASELRVMVEGGGLKTFLPHLRRRGWK